MDRHFDVAIAGAGHGGAQVAIALRAQGFSGSIGLIGDDPELPYERPPLSKEYLAGEKSFDRLLIRPRAFWSDRAITLCPDTSITGVDPATRTLVTTRGTTGYGDLVWATGGTARRLTCAGHDLAGIHTVRSRADVDAMIAALPSVTRIVVIGGGYIGLEAAAVLIKLGKAVTLVEALPRVLARVAGEPLSRYIEDAHRARGVDLRLDAMVDRIEGESGQVTGVRLADDTLLAADMVVVGIGIVPAVAPLIAAGADGANGVMVDAQCRTSLPHVFAVGDCALHPNRFARGSPIRLESVQNASDQAMVAARTIAGHPAAYDAVPWFWSNQYDLKLQTVGLSTGFDTTVIRRPAEGHGLTVVYLRDGQVIALDCIDMTRDYVQGRALVLAGARIDPVLLADPQRPLKTLYSAAD